jgi:predicted adenine nucleotide alpha hydrolase (AANH) superfamily ATPase
MNNSIQAVKPQLVLHICCAPDEAWVVHSLKEIYSLHCFFCNPNLSPESEYHLRLQEARRVAERYDVPFSEDPYEPDSWEKAVATVAGTPEGGERCNRCFALRLGRTARFCMETGIPSFTTVMSISPHKRITMLNESGHAAAAAFGVAYVQFDFKKKDGFRKSILLSNELGLYRQDYCGCRLSREERNFRRKKVT